MVDPKETNNQEGTEITNNNNVPPKPEPYFPPSRNTSEDNYLEKGSNTDED